MESIKYIQSRHSDLFNAAHIKAAYMKLSTRKLIALIALSLALALLPLIVIYWSKRSYIFFLYETTTHHYATHVKITQVRTLKRGVLSKFAAPDHCTNNPPTLLYKHTQKFTYRCQQYTINTTTHQCQLLELDCSIPNNELIQKLFLPFDANSLEYRKTLYGDKSVYQPPIKGFILIFLTEIIKPIYIFQVYPSPRYIAWLFGFGILTTNSRLQPSA